jgi:chromosome partitioning protein
VSGRRAQGPDKVLGGLGWPFRSRKRSRGRLGWPGRDQADPQGYAQGRITQIRSAQPVGPAGGGAPSALPDIGRPPDVAGSPDVVRSPEPGGPGGTGPVPAVPGTVPYLAPPSVETAAPALSREAPHGSIQAPVDVSRETSVLTLDPPADPLLLNKDVLTHSPGRAEVSEALAPGEEPRVDPAEPPDVSRETTRLTQAPLGADVTAAQRPSRDGTNAANGTDTPLATAVEYSLKVRQGLAHREPFPRPASTRVMVVANQKGGVGKTTTTVNMAAALAQHGLNVLVVDLDPQGNASTALAIEHRRGTPSTYDALVDGTPLAEIAQPSPEDPRLLVVPATIDLAGAEIELVSVVARENRLRKAIHGWDRVGEGEDRFDYVLIDCPPSLGLLTLNALVAGDELLLPIQSEYYALEGVGQLLETVELVRANLNSKLSITTVLLTMYDARTRLSAGVADEVREHFGDRVLKTAIPRAVRVSEAPSFGQSVMAYDPASPGALSYLEAAREMSTKGVQG